MRCGEEVDGFDDTLSSFDDDWWWTGGSSQSGGKGHRPTVPGKFLNLIYLRITFEGLRSSRSYDYFSLCSFLDASLLETFILCILLKGKHDLSFISKDKCLNASMAASKE
uniref:At1g61320/AtMIF1 LRR domain-containing protein n=1 Tax=Leersia perrieri TaxID=77586 RepID=A0A0D9VRA5_9ORYZ